MHKGQDRVNIFEVYFILFLVMDQPRSTENLPDMTENIDLDVKTQHEQKRKATVVYHCCNQI